MLSKNVEAILELNCIVAQLRKKQDKFCHGTTALRICFVDIVVSCDLSVLWCSQVFFQMMNVIRMSTVSFTFTYHTQQFIIIIIFTIFTITTCIFSYSFSLSF